LVERLGNRLDLLKGGARDAPERQRALRDTIAWSYELLTDDEQRLLALLAVFSGTTIEAVESVAARVESLDTIDVLDGLASLVDKSLVRQVDSQTTGTRLSMLETIRAFAAERLDDDGRAREAGRRAHAEYFADWSLDHCEKLTGEDRESASERMAADMENLTAAWAYWLAVGDFEQLGKLADGLWLLYNVRGWYHETTRLVTDLLAVLSSTPSSEERVADQIVLQTTLARVLMASEGFTPETERAYERALELCSTQGELPQLLPVLRGLSTYYIYRADFETAEQLGQQLLDLGERFDDARARVEGNLLVGASNSMLARLHVGIEHVERAIAEYDEAPRLLERFEAGNDPGVVSHIVEAMLLWMTGFPDRARAHSAEAITLAERLHHPQSAAYAHFHTGLIHAWLRDSDQAAAHARIVIELGDAHDFNVWSAVGSCLLGVATAASGATDEGLAHFEAAMARYRELQSPPVFWPSLLHFRAMLLGMAGRPHEGLASVDEALDVIAGLPEPQTLASELLLVKGDLVLAQTRDAAAAEVWYERSLASAEQLDASMLRLRPALALARVWHAQGRDADARTLLGDAYGRFTEGFAARDLIDARRLLDELMPTT
jgi:predicted ATPase